MDVLDAFGTLNSSVDSLRKTAETAAAGYRNVLTTVNGIPVTSPVSGSSSPTLLSQDTGIRDEVPDTFSQLTTWAMDNKGTIIGGILLLILGGWAIKKWG